MTQRSTVTALAVVAGVLAAAAALFVALFLAERAALGELNGRIAETERGIAEETDRLSRTRSTVDELDVGADELSAAITDLRACADPARTALEAAQAVDTARLDTAVEQMLAHCGR